MEICGSETLQPANKFKMFDRWMSSFFSLQKLLCWKVRNFLIRNKALVYLLSLYNFRVNTLKFRANLKKNKHNRPLGTQSVGRSIVSEARNINIPAPAKYAYPFVVS